MDLPTLVNLGLQGIGTRTTVTAAELANQSSNEAIQANLAILQTRDELLRMAPWNCSTGFIPLQYITSLPGTNENQSTPANQLQWSPGLPLPPSTYEYQLPVDCLRALSVVSNISTGLGMTPIYPTSTMTGYSQFGFGPPVKFTESIDTFYSATAAAVATAGTGYSVGEILTLNYGLVSSPPIGCPAQLLVTSVNGSGGVTGVSVINDIINSATPFGGSYFAPPINPVGVGLPYPGFYVPSQSAPGPTGAGATFNLTMAGPLSQRVILTNLEYAVLRYCRQVTDPNVMDPLFQKAWYNILGAVMTMALTGDKQLANSKIGIANGCISEARAVDGNEGLTVNDVTPDWIRVRGITYSDYWNSGTSFDWGTTGWGMY